MVPETKGALWKVKSPGVYFEVCFKLQGQIESNYLLKEFAFLIN